MDNTAGDNKNAEMVIFLGWLVQHDFFQDASFFCQLKGHTFTVLDQSFDTLISQLLAEAIYSMSSLINSSSSSCSRTGATRLWLEVHQL